MIFYVSNHLSDYHKGGGVVLQLGMRAECGVWECRVLRR
jgi:hypothetical protein